MRPHDRVIAVLLRIYPVAWRREYGAELADVLAQRPLTAAIVVDVLWNGAAQRLRPTEPTARIGVISLFASNHIARVPDEDREARGLYLILSVGGMALSLIGWFRWIT